MGHAAGGCGGAGRRSDPPRLEATRNAAAQRSGSDLALDEAVAGPHWFGVPGIADGWPRSDARSSELAPACCWGFCVASSSVIYITEGNSSPLVLIPFFDREADSIDVYLPKLFLGSIFMISSD